MIDAWLPDLGRAGGAKYQAIADAIDAAIARGELRGGDRLPAQRDVAERLGIDLTTVTRAYDKARQRGLIEARGRAGSFVRLARTEPQTEVLPDSGMNMPPDLEGLLEAALTRSLSTLLRDRSAGRLLYQQPGGASQDRVGGAALLTSRGVPATGEQVVVTAGGQNALHAILSTAFVSGDRIACRTHVYPGFRGAAERLGLELVPLEELSADSIAATDDLAGIYVVPTNDNPTAATLTQTERETIAAVAERRGLRIIEDDAYGPLAAEPLSTLASLAPDQVWHIASTSKILSPSLRVAHVRAPNIGAAIRLAVDVHETAVMAPPLNAALVSAWIADGTFDRLLVAMRAACAARQALARTILAGFDYAAHPQGYHLWLRLPEGQRATLLVDSMRASGLALVDASRFAVREQQDEAVRISLGGAMTLDRLSRGLRLLHGHVAAPALRASALV